MSTSGDGTGSRPSVHLAPRGNDWLEQAVRDGGGRVVALADATALVWTSSDDPGGLAALLADHPAIDWVQLPWAGVDPYRSVFDHERRWTCAKGAYAEPVAEHALALLLGGLRGVVRYSRTDSWSTQFGTNLFGGQVTIVGGGEIAEALLKLLARFDARITVVRRRPQPMPGVAEVVGIDRLHDALPGADGVVLALAATPDTVGLIGERELDLMEPHAWLVNVARGVHVQTDALVAALANGTIGGAALDVTDPEPLPATHPLWSLANCVITPHTANTVEMAKPRLAGRVAENVRRYASGEPLMGSVDPDLGY